MTKDEEYKEVIRNSKIIDDIVYESGKLIIKATFIKHGGNMEFIKKHFGSYPNFIESLGYNKDYIGTQRYILYDSFKNEVIKIGNLDELLETDELKGSLRKSVQNCLGAHYKIKGRYCVAYTFIDLEQFGYKNEKGESVF